MKTKELAQIAYRAYGNWAAWKTPQGQTLPVWNELPVSIQNAWTAATEAVVADMAKEGAKATELSNNMAAHEKRVSLMD